MYDNNYWGIGERLGKAWSVGKKFGENNNEKKAENNELKEINIAGVIEGNKQKLRNIKSVLPERLF